MIYIASLFWSTVVPVRAIRWMEKLRTAKAKVRMEGQLKRDSGRMGCEKGERELDCMCESVWKDTIKSVHLTHTRNTPRRHGCERPGLSITTIKTSNSLLYLTDHIVPNCVCFQTNGTRILVTSFIFSHQSPTTRLLPYFSYILISPSLFPQCFHYL